MCVRVMAMYANNVRIRVLLYIDHTTRPYYIYTCMTLYNQMYSHI